MDVSDAHVDDPDARIRAWEQEQLRDVLEKIRARESYNLWNHIAVLPRAARELATDYAIQSGYDPRYPELPDDETILTALSQQAQTVDARNRVRRYSDIPRDKLLLWIGKVRQVAVKICTLPPEFQAYFWIHARLWQGPATGATGRATVVNHYISGAAWCTGRRIQTPARYPPHGFWLGRAPCTSRGGRLCGRIFLGVDAPPGISSSAVDAYDSWRLALRTFHIYSPSGTAGDVWSASLETEWHAKT